MNKKEQRKLADEVMLLLNDKLVPLLDEHVTEANAELIKTVVLMVVNSQVRELVRYGVRSLAEAVAEARTDDEKKTT